MAVRDDKLTEAIIGCAYAVANTLAQCLNYLKATDLNVCLLINFGSPRIEVKRVMRPC